MKHLFFSFALLCAFSATTFADGPIPQPPGQPRPYSVVQPAPSPYWQVFQIMLSYI